jgi:MFS family permease
MDIATLRHSTSHVMAQAVKSLWPDTKLGIGPSIEDGFFLSRKALRPSIIGSFSLIMWGALAAFFPLYAVSQGVANPGVFFGACALTLIVGRMLGGRILDRYSRERVILPCLIAFIASMTLLSFSKTLPLFILVAVIYGAGLAFFFPALVVYTVERAGAARGPAMGTFTAAGDLGMGLGAVIMGVVVRLTTYPIMFFCLALVAVISLGYFYYVMRDRHKTP